MLRDFARLHGYVLLILSLMALGCGGAADPWKKTAGPADGKKILVSFAPLYCFAKTIAADNAKVLCLLQGTGPHDYEPSPYDALKARGADLILINGLELDGFITKIINSSGNRTAPLVKVAEQSNLKLIKMGHHDHGDGHHHHHGEHDPHVWLGLDEAQQMVNRVTAVLQEVDPANAKVYGERAKTYLGKIEELRKEAITSIKSKKNKKIITMHDSMQYFARGLGLEIVDTIQIRPGVEASQKKILDLVTLCKEKDVRVIATEPQYSDDLAKQIRERASKLGQTVELVPIDPIETAPPGFDATHYLETMTTNIRNLAKSLQ